VPPRAAPPRARRCGDHRVRRGDDVLGRPAVEFHRQERDDGVPDRDPLDAVAERVDDAGHVVAGDVRQLDRDRQEPAPHPVVRRVERRGGDAQSHLPGARGGLLDVLGAEHLRTADLVEPYCLHDRALRRCCSCASSSKQLTMTLALLRTRSNR
jgi:hypothetical protein